MRNNLNWQSPSPSPSPSSSLQEIVGACGQAEAAAALALTFAAQICTDRPERHPHQIVWVRQDAAARETGDPFGPGLAALAVESDDLLIVHAHTFADTMRAGLEAVRCPAVSVALIETTAPVDLTTSRRLKLAAEKSGVATILLRHADVEVSNSSATRWCVKAAPCREADAAQKWPPIPRAVFDVTLTKHPTGLAGKQWVLEWDHEQRHFRSALPLPMATVPFGRSLAS